MIPITATITTNPARPLVIGGSRLFRIGSYLIQFPSFRLGVGYCVDDSQDWRGAAKEYARKKFVRAWFRYLNYERLMTDDANIAAELDRLEPAMRELIEAEMQDDALWNIVREIRSLRAAGHDPATVMLSIIGAINEAAYPAVPA